MNAQKILVVLIIGMFFLLITSYLTSNNKLYTRGLTASADKVKVGCKDLAFPLITWDQLLPLVAEDDIAENEHQLNEYRVQPDTYHDITFTPMTYSRILANVT